MSSLVLTPVWKCALEMGDHLLMALEGDRHAEVRRTRSRQEVIHST
jgi:hypothetical protein